MEKKSQKGAFLGGPTILTVLMILCFAVFSLMALLRANADLNMTRRTAESTEGWYAADAEAETLLQEILDRSDLAPEALVDAAGALLDAKSIQWSWDGDAAVFCYMLPVDAYRTMTVSLHVEPDGSGSAVTVTAWQTAAEDPIVEPSYLPVFQ